MRIFGSESIDGIMKKFGLKEGESWCVCASSYAQAIEAGLACQIYLRKTNEKTLELIPLNILKKYAIDLL